MTIHSLTQPPDFSVDHKGTEKTGATAGSAKKIEFQDMSTSRLLPSNFQQSGASSDCADAQG